MDIIVDDTEIRIEDGRVEEDITEMIDRYTDGERVEFDVDIDLSEYSPFQRIVLKAVRAIPYGETRTYKEIAEAIGTEGGAQAVAQACNQNPVPIVIPCHRVVASDGLGGYKHGKEVKRTLLEHEGAI